MKHMSKFKILDCTLRDGGYYTNWDFNQELVDTYIDACNSLPLDYLEVGYRSNPMKEYFGQYFYLPKYVMERLKAKTNKKLVIMLNEKDISSENVKELLYDCIGYISMVRLAIDPKNFARAIELATEGKKIGFEIGFNVMYMSTWKDQKGFLELLPSIKGVADYFYMVDSFGGVNPDDVRETFNLVRSKVDVPIGFHGHNNLEMALINSLTAIECGASIVDATITGMGRGAGNLKTELLLTSLNAKGQLDFDFNALSKVVDSFRTLQEEHGWGTNLPYMVSGANSLPQKDVMDWVGKRYFSFNSIIRALHNQSLGVQDNRELPKFRVETATPKVLIVGGGASVRDNSDAIQIFLRMNPEMTVIHASSKNAMLLTNIPNKQIFCLVGNEGHRMEEVFQGLLPKNAICVLPPFPRKMGTYIPNALEEYAYELPEVTFTRQYVDSHTSIALQTALVLNAKSIFLVGYDGYSYSVLLQKDQELFLENEFLFARFQEYQFDLLSLTFTSYTELKSESIFSMM
jgi:4-hydroxy 2-oxovalerate aldolase